MTPEESGQPRTLGQKLGIEPIPALENTARSASTEAAEYIAKALATDDHSKAAVLYGFAATSLKTASGAVAALWKESKRQT